MISEILLNKLRFLILLLDLVQRATGPEPGNLPFIVGVEAHDGISAAMGIYLGYPYAYPQGKESDFAIGTQGLFL